MSEALDEIDLDALRPEDGRFDLDALAALDAPLTRVRDALVELKATSEESRSPWLVEPGDVRARRLRARASTSTCRRSRTPCRRSAWRPRCSAPTSPARTSLLFTTPSESRGLGGFVGSYAELTIDDGQLTLGEFGRAQDLDAAIAGRRRPSSGTSDEFLAQYGRFGYDADGTGTGLVGDSAVAQPGDDAGLPDGRRDRHRPLRCRRPARRSTASSRWTRSWSAQLLRYTGPVLIPSLGREIGPDEALPFLLRDQYTADVPDEQRADGLAEAASQAFDGLIGGALPDPDRAGPRPRPAHRAIAGCSCGAPTPRSRT